MTDAYKIITGDDEVETRGEVAVHRTYNAPDRTEILSLDQIDSKIALLESHVASLRAIRTKVDVEAKKVKLSTSVSEL